VNVAKISLRELFFCHCWHIASRCIFVNFDVIVPLIKSFCLVQGHVKKNCKGKKLCLAQEREIKVIQNTQFSQNREIKVSRNMRTSKSRNIRVAKISCNKVVKLYTLHQVKIGSYKPTKHKQPQHKQENKKQASKRKARIMKA